MRTSKACTDRPYSFVRKPSKDKFFCYLCGGLFGKDLLLVSHLINDHADQSERLERIGIGLLPLRKQLDNAAAMRSYDKTRKRELKDQKQREQSALVND